MDGASRPARPGPRRGDANANAGSSLERARGPVTLTPCEVTSKDEQGLSEQGKRINNFVFVTGGSVCVTVCV